MTLLFEPVTGTTTPAAELASPQVLSKPDITATDCNLTTFFNPTATFGVYRFCGTSAAAPHAAGVAALQLQRAPSATVAAVKAAQLDTAAPIGAFGPLDVGEGLLDAQKAVAAMGGSPPGGGGGGGGGGASTNTPSVSITGGPEGLVNTGTPTFTFTVSDPLATSSCRFDSAPFGACSGPGAAHAPAAPLADGPHTFEVKAKNLPGIESPVASRAFSVDTVKPALRIDRKPRKRTKAKKAVFEFVTDGSAVTCKLDAKAAKACKSPVRYKRLKPKKHKLVITATDPAGNATSVTHRWTVKKLKKKRRK